MLRADEIGDLLRRRPDVAEMDRVAVLVVAERLVDEVDLQRAGERIGDHQRRRGEVVGAHVRIDAALEIAVAREHRRRDQVARADRRRDRFGQRAGIADAGGAAEADEVEAELVEIGLQPGLRQIFADHLAARRERRLHPRLGLQPLRQGVAGEQPGADHHARVGGVGAGGDRRDHHVAMADIEGGAVDRHALGDLAALLELAVERRDETLLGVAEEHAVLRALRSGERRLDAVEIEGERVGENRVRACRSRGTGPAPGHRPRPARRARARARSRRDSGASRRRSGNSRRWRRIPAPCCRWWRGPRAPCCRGRGRRTRRTCRPRSSCAASR